MATFPCRQLFTIAGFFHSKYDPTQNNFKFSKTLLVYGVVLTIIMQGFNILQIFFLLEPERSVTYVGSGHEWIGQLVIFLENVFWMVINLAHPVIIIVRRRHIAKYINGFVEYEKKLSSLDKDPNVTDKQLETSVIFWLIFGCLVVLGCFGLGGYTSFYEIVIGLPITFEFILGHLFEFVFLKKVRKHLIILQGSFNTDGKLHDWLSLEMQLIKLAKLCGRIFVNLKIVLLLSATMLLSVYWFMNFDIEVNICSALLWQLLISTVLMLCHIWDEMSSEVSTALFF